MDRGKLNIPMPNERTIQLQVERIVALGVKKKESFPTFLRTMLQQVGLRHLFADRSGLALSFFSTFILLSVFIIFSKPAIVQHEMYAAIFLLSPIMFLVFSIYTYVSKALNDTYEVEMSCTYNVYQIIAFRMLAFSILAILVNTVSIAMISSLFEEVHFLRAFMISITALFSFSILFLYALMKRRTTIIVTGTVVGWIVGNLVLRSMDNQLYHDILVTMPLFVYAIVLSTCVYIYVKYMNRLIHFRGAKGVF